MEAEKKTVCMLSDMHNLLDDRIYWKEAVSLKKEGYNVLHIGFANNAQDYYTNEGIRIIAVKKRVFHSNIFLHKLLKTLSCDNPHKVMWNCITQVKADAYHMHDVKILRFAKRMKKLSWKPKVLYDIHEDYGDIVRFYNKLNWLLKGPVYLYAFLIDWHEKRRAAYCDYFIPVTPYIEDKFRKTCPSVPSKIIFNYTNLEIAANNVNAEKIYDLIYSGSINWTRGILEIIKASEIICQFKPSLKVLIIGSFGSEEYRNFILGEIQKRKLEKNIILHTMVDYNQMHQFYSQSKIGLGVFYPIKIFTYAIQIKTFEYMAFGLPILCSNFGYINKYVEESNTGIAIDPLNPQSIADAAIQLLSNTELYNQLSKNGIHAARHRYNWYSEALKLCTIYKTLIN